MRTNKETFEITKDNITVKVLPVIEDNTAHYYLQMRVNYPCNE